MADWPRIVDGNARGAEDVGSPSGRGGGAPREGRRSVPAIVGLGRTGLRIASWVSARACDDLALCAVVPDHAPAGPSPVPMIVWAAGHEARSAEQLIARVGSAPAAVVAFGLGANAPAQIAPQVAEALRARARMIAAIGVLPFSFEGSERLDLAGSVAGRLAATVDLFAFASRDDVRLIAPADTPLERACELVDEMASRGAEALARVLARRSEPLPFAAKGCILGASQAEGHAAVTEAIRAALRAAFADVQRAASSHQALLTLAIGRTPTLGEVGAAEDLLREALAPGADVTFDIATCRSLGERALAAVCVAPPAVGEGEDVFPSEDPTVQEVPAFIRRRAAGKARSRRVRSPGWARSA
jgi:hypothetical protein